MRSLALALAISVLAPAGAAASTTLGQTSSSTGPCSANSLYWQSSGTSPSYEVPAGGGVITKWSTNPGAASGFHERLIVIRHGATQFIFAGHSDYEALAPSVESTFQTRIPVQAGDQMGLESQEPNGPCQIASPSSGSILIAADPSPATTFDFAVGPIGPHAINASAVVEPDADQDGFGDETQDACPADPTAQANCPADVSITNAPNAASVALGGTVGYTIQVKNNSTSQLAANVQVHDSLPGRLSLVNGCSPSCVLGTLAPGATGTATLSALGSMPGDTLNTASVSSSTPDGNMANNSAGAAVRVLPHPFKGVSLRSKQLPVSGRFATLRVFCPANVFGGCSGSVVVRTARRLTVPASRSHKRVLKLGSGKFRVGPGKTVRVRVKLTKSGRKLLALKHKVKAVATFTAHDQASQTKVTKVGVTLKRRRR